MKNNIAKGVFGDSPDYEFDKSTSFWDEILWGGAWIYYATGNITYLELVTSHELATRVNAFGNNPDYGVFSWDNKLPGTQNSIAERVFGNPYPQGASSNNARCEQHVPDLLRPVEIV
ncbi:unnamed protein product [Microthlaspi erraticum]|uniref:cellulase n=1 Tax=Microthlaspi erraticum TaxID=1685480 RepID=A0A6D2KTF4_9BRAS|nr:unnamed protein product [Microthlaspi erraticum]